MSGQKNWRKKCVNLDDKYMYFQNMRFVCIYLRFKQYLNMIWRKLDVWTADFLVNINLKEECSSEHLFLIYYKLFLFPGTVKVYFKFCRECRIFARDELLLRALPCSCMLEKTFIVIYFVMSFNPAAVLIQTDMWWGVGRLSEATGRFPGAGAKISVYPLPGSSVLQTLTHSHIVSL